MSLLLLLCCSAICETLPEYRFQIISDSLHLSGVESPFVEILDKDSWQIRHGESGSVDTLLVFPRQSHLVHQHKVIDCHKQSIRLQFRESGSHDIEYNVRDLGADTPNYLIYYTICGDHEGKT